MSDTIKKKLRHPGSGKLLSRIFVTGKGWYEWNQVYKVYNSKLDYEQLKTSDLENIDFGIRRDRF
jgi:hypothetical protein